MQTVSLAGDWKLYYHPEIGVMPESPTELLEARWPVIDAKVPGNVELDLMRSGLEEDPYYNQNIYRFRNYEFYQWWYIRSFGVPAEFEGDRCVLRFDGVDTFSDVFVNGIFIGSTDNMLIEHEFDVTNVLAFGSENNIAVRIRSTINEVRKMDYPVCCTGNEGVDEYTQVRKAASMFGWDIMPRLISAGLWRGIQLCALPKHRITQVYAVTTHIEQMGSAFVNCRVRFATDDPYLDGFSVSIEGQYGDSSFRKEVSALFVSLQLDVEVPNAKLWWPRGYGEQPLYDVKVTLKHHGEPVDEYTLRMGLRLLTIDARWEAGDNGEFRIICNGTPILAKGSNWVPMDALHSRDAERMPAALDLFEDAGCNIVRCWGGNVYEDTPFYDQCDERGIMVWQDFGMGCAVYAPKHDLIDKLEKEATAVIRKLRNHACLLLWAGDNEGDESYIWQGFHTAGNNYNELTREVLPHIVRMEDPYRIFIPSSPYLPKGIPYGQTPEQHNWGARAYFKDDYYKHSKAYFISECGYHGCPPVSSLRRYIPEDKLVPWLNNDVWDTHNTENLMRGRRGYNRIQLMNDQVALYFGTVPEELETFAILSQIVQAEAKKFFIERTRIKKWRRTGIIWWNMIDGWPQISDAVVDYYYAKKLAYHYIKRVQRPICLMMDELVDWTHDVVLGNDSLETKKVKWRVEEGETGEVLMQGTTVSPANENVVLGAIREMAGMQRLYLLKYEIDGKQYANHYISGFPHYEAERMLKWVETIRKMPEPFEWTK